MDLIRNFFDAFYDSIKPLTFLATKNDPEKAHKLFSKFCQWVYKNKLEKIIFDNSSNNISLPFKISNAAGFDKNCEIPFSVLKYFGFDRIVIGTVTYQEWKGNPKPNILRYPKTHSLVNWMEFPGNGAKKIAERVKQYNNENMPVTISIMARPDKIREEEIISDISETMNYFKNISCVDRFELNNSCPNLTKNKAEHLEKMLEKTKNSLNPNQELYLKVSPDLKKEEIDIIFNIAKDYVSGFTTTNTTKIHKPLFIKNSPGKGGASGNAVYEDSLRIQKLFYKKIKNQNKNFKIIACGGINSVERVKERIYNGASEIQIFTPFIYFGTKLLREIRNGDYSR